jgi:hypothetical protein
MGAVAWARRSGRPASKIGIGAGALGVEGFASYLHPALATWLALADVGLPTLVVLTLLAVILCGSKDKMERVFRFLRWIANRPEPPAPVLAVDVDSVGVESPVASRARSRGAGSTGDKAPAAPA